MVKICQIIAGSILTSIYFKLLKARRMFFCLAINIVLNKRYSILTCKEIRMGYILLAVLCIAVLYMLFREKKPTETTESGKDWPYGEKLPEGKVHVKVDEVSAAAEAVTTVVENKVDPVAVALDLEPMDISGATPAKKPRKPREPKAATPTKKPAAKKTAKKVK
jgi:hypothetical protein